MDSRVYWNLNAVAIGQEIYGFCLESQGTNFFRRQIEESSMHFCGFKKTEFGGCVFFRKLENEAQSSAVGLAVLVFLRPPGKRSKTFLEYLVILQRFVRLKLWA